uniref:Galectin n=1 Tax=Sphenodon punctatus TaxID=8508 RepID=A0A8D0G856_SPHPU
MYLHTSTSPSASLCSVKAPAHQFPPSLSLPQPLPYVSPVPGGLQSGMSIYVQGSVPQHTKRFRVNFSCGQHEGADVALHFNPRFDGDKVVFNSMQGKKWGKEEHKGHMPFHKGQHFEIIFIVENDAYKVVVNGQPYYEFRHRIPPQQVQAVNVDGDLELQSLTVIGSAMGGGGVSVLPHTERGDGEDGTGLLWRERGLGAKRTVIIKGLIPQGAKRYFCWASSRDPRPPLPSLSPSQLSIRCGNQRFKVFANGQPLFDYNHRFQNFQQIDTLEISGDVVLSFVQF